MYDHDFGWANPRPVAYYDRWKQEFREKITVREAGFLDSLGVEMILFSDVLPVFVDSSNNMNITLPLANQVINEFRQNYSGTVGSFELLFGPPEDSPDFEQIFNHSIIDFGQTEFYKQLYQNFDYVEISFQPNITRLNDPSVEQLRNQFEVILHDYVKPLFDVVQKPLYLETIFPSYDGANINTSRVFTFFFSTDITIDITDSTGIVPGASFGGNLAWGDYNNDGYLDIYMTRGDFMSANLYKNNGSGTFTDVTISAGVGLQKANAVAWADVDNDGDLDLFVTRPAVIDSPYVLFRNNGDGTFTDIALLANMVRDSWFPGNDGATPGQGAAWSDFNNDGRVDLFVANNTPPDFLFENRGNGAGNHYLTIKLIGKESNRSAIGARVKIEAGGIKQIRGVEGGANTSQNSLPVEFGLGQAHQVDKIAIRWPSGLEESTVRSVAADQIITITEGAVNVVGVAEDADSGVPEKFRLFQNYPNPFNPATTVQYQIPQAGYVILKIYNLTGQEVQTLVDEVKQSGIYKITWDGKNRQGRTVGTGMYVIRMKAGEFTKSKKIVLLK